MADYYVAKTGSDAGGVTGAIGDPWLTINHGITHSGHALTGGDTLWIRTGTYDEEIQWPNSYPKGSSGLPILLKNYNDEVVTIQPTGSPGWCFNFNDTEYITIDGLILDAVNTTYDGIKITIGSSYLSHHIRVLNCEIKNAGTQGVLQGGDASELIGCHIHHNGPLTGNQDHGVYWTGTNGLIENNDVHDNTWQGIQQYNSGSGGRDNNIIRGNKFYDNPGAGITTGSGDNNFTYNNLVWGNSVGISVGHTGATNCHVYNNTIYNNTGVAILYQYTSGTHYIKNNILWSNGTDAIVEGLSAGSATIVDTNNSVLNPGFLSTTPADPDYLKIDDNSTNTYNLGTDLTTVFNNNSLPLEDYAGNARPQDNIWDIGAYEFVTEIPDEPPVNTIGNQTAVQNVASVMSGISVADVNADCLTIWFQLEDGKGTLSGSDVGTATGTFV